jgi:hypothetical protein
VLTLAQLEDLGLSARGVRHRAASGRLQRVHHGVYAIQPVGTHGRWMAAVLACGTGAVLSHRSAAALWDLVADQHSRADVTVTRRAGRSRDGIAVHRGESLAPADIAVHEGIPCTTVARTLLDLASSFDRRTLERAVDEAEARRRFDLTAVHDVLLRNPGRPGTRALTTIITEYQQPTATRSDSEEQMLRLIADAGLPRPRTNVWIALDGGGGYEADFLWPDRRLIVEVDGRTHHARRRAFAHDRRRDRLLALAGFETRRYAASELTAVPARVAAELRTFLGP